MRVLFCGGGTAGHVMPALAICDIIKSGFAKSEFAFVGRCGGIENKSIIDKGYKLYTIEMQGFERKISTNSIKSIIKLIKCSRKAKDIIFEFKPDIIIGTGGYVCYPIIRQGQRMKIKTIIHESNAYPGLVTRLVGKKCNALLLNNEAALEHLKFKYNARVVGNPLRSEFASIDRDDARRKLGIGKNDFFIVSFGGSLGSEIINKNVIGLIRNFSVPTASVRHLHAVGKKHYDDIKKSNPDLCRGICGCKITAYIDDMPTALKAADLAITRSGAMTLSELASSATPSILIPSPNVTANHQYFNAKALLDKNAAVLLTESELSESSLENAVVKIFNNRAFKEQLKRNINSFSNPYADQMILKAIKEVFYR